MYRASLRLEKKEMYKGVVVATEPDCLQAKESSPKESDTG